MNEKTKKIIFLDDWSASYEHIVKRITGIIGNDNIAYKFIHLDSLNNKSKMIKHELRENVEIRDVTAYKHPLDIIGILKDEQPDLVIVFDKGSLTQRAYVHACRKLGIKTLQLQHGSLISSDDNQSFSKKRRGFRFYYKNFSRISVSVLIYIITCMKIDAFFFIKPEKVKYLITFLTNYRKFFHDMRDDVLCDKVLCFSEKDRHTLMKNDLYPLKSIKVIGNYFLGDLSKYMQVSDSEFKREFLLSQGLRQDYSYITLISQALAEDNWKDFSGEKICCLIEDIYYNILQNSDKFLIVKLHPREQPEKYRRIINNPELMKRIVIMKDGDLNALIKVSDAVLGFFSSALLTAAAFKKKVFIIRWMTTEEFPVDYTSLKMSEDVHSIEDLKNSLSRLDGDSGKTPEENNRDYYIGPPFSEERLKKEVMEMLQRAS